MFRTVDFEMLLPSLRSSPTMRRAPHRGLLVFISITRFRTSSLVTGRPRDFWQNVHLRATSFRCQARTVLGEMVTILPTTRSLRRRSKTKNNRSHEIKFWSLGAPLQHLQLLAQHEYLLRTPRRHHQPNKLTDENFKNDDDVVPHAQTLIRRPEN